MALRSCIQVYLLFPVPLFHLWAIFVGACLKGLNEDPDVVECSFVQSNITELPFFASKAPFEKQEDIQLMRFADYFGRAFAKVDESILRESSVEKMVDACFRQLV